MSELRMTQTAERNSHDRRERLDDAQCPMGSHTPSLITRQRPRGPSMPLCHVSLRIPDRVSVGRWGVRHESLRAVSSDDPERERPSSGRERERRVGSHSGENNEANFGSNLGSEKQNTSDIVQE